jgi:phosphosulfolactate synthase
MLIEHNKDRVDSIKPRKEGLTCVVDRLQAIDKENFEILSPYIDIVKVHNVIPLLISDSTLERKIKYYHSLDIRVSTGSTIAELTI